MKYSTFFKLRILHHRFQRVLIRVHSDGLGQITVTFCIVCHQLADARQNVEGIGIVSFAKRVDNRFRKLENQQSAARLQHAVHGAQRFIFIGHVTQTERDGDAVERIIRERQRFGVGLNIFNVAYHADITQLFASHFQHGVVDIRQHHAAGFANQTGEFSGQIPCASG
ncbi:hypothetical protein HR12_28935 [Microbacterium sp. SUBG005]|nr:hypothetical protein HR12_28935 [Microbacterium sp. SUBG005]